MNVDESGQGRATVQATPDDVCILVAVRIRCPSLPAQR